MINYSVGIVTYNPDIVRLTKCIEAVLGSGATIFVFDNASSNIREIEKLFFDRDNILLIKSDRNVGIAVALNKLTKLAANKESEWILTLDQDSICPLNMICEYEKYIHNEKAGIICPFISDINSKYNYNEQSVDGTISKCITSGSLVNIKAWKSVKGYDESMFIDGVDFDFCRRIRKKGFLIYRTDNVHLVHEIGHITQRKFLMFNVMVKNHTAFRKYYIARNTVYLERKSGNTVVILLSCIRVLKQAIIVLLYETDKKKKTKAIMRGFVVGLTCRINKLWK